MTLALTTTEFKTLMTASHDIYSVAPIHQHILLKQHTTLSSSAQRCGTQTKFISRRCRIK